MSQGLINQIAFDQIPVRKDGARRCPCLLLLDTSQSMAGTSIRMLNEGVRLLHRDLQGDDHARISVEIAVISFGPLRIISDYADVDRFHPMDLQAEGDTPMGQAVLTGLELLEERKKSYRAEGIPYYKPWVFLITDGAYTDKPDVWKRACEAVHDGESANKFAFFSLAVEECDHKRLSELSNRPPAKLRDISKFAEFFKWVSSSLRDQSRSNPEEVLKLRPTLDWNQA